MASILRICTFKGLQNLPLYVAQRQGFFAQQGLEIEISYTAGSKAQLAGLAYGDYDLVQTAPDNVVNVNTHPEAFELDAATLPHILMILGGSNGPLSLYAQPDYTTCAALRGKVLGVDNPTSGYALVMRDLLQRNALLPNRDYSITIAGGTSTRLDALRSGAIAATILYMPFDQLAEEEGFPRLACSTDYYSAYASLATAGVQAWLEEHSDEVTGYIAACLQALRWLYEPQNMLAAQHLMQSESTLGLDERLAARAYTAFIDPVHGFGREALLDDAGLEQVIQLRAAYNQGSTSYGTVEDYRDMHWYQQARERGKDGN